MKSTDPGVSTTLARLGCELKLPHLSLLIFTVTYVLYAFSAQGNPPSFEMPRAGEVVRVALSVARSGEFADPYNSFPTGPTAHPAPGYVLVFAAVAKVFGEGYAGAIVLWALNLAFLALQLALLPVLSERLGLGVLPGVLAAAFGAIFQPYRVLPEWETLLVGAWLVVLCVLTVPYFRAPASWKHSLLLGFLWGMALLTNPLCVLLLLAWPHFASSGNAPGERSRARRAMLVVLAGAALVCLPWVVRNYRQFHSIFFIRNNFGLELAVSNNPCARPTLLENIVSGCHRSTHPNPNPALAAQIFEKGEMAYNREQMRAATGWIRANPRAFAWLTLRRFWRFWFPYLTGLRYAIPSAVLTALSLLGLAIMYRRRRRAALILGSTLVLYPLIHYLVQFEARYRYPIYWATLLLAGYAVMEAARWFRNRSASVAGAAQSGGEVVTALETKIGAEGGS